MEIKLNLGCASNILDGYINIDQDTFEEIKSRYPNKTFNPECVVYNYDVFNLPYDDDSVDEILADGFIEHLSFIDEKRMFMEVKRVLKKGGLFEFSVPNFEKVVRLWLEAEDDWQDFYRLDDDAIDKCHWFGTYTYEPKNRWGYLTAQLYGSQHGDGQYHKNCYTKNKIEKIFNFLQFDSVSIEEFNWKGDRDPMLRSKVIK